MHAPSAQNKSEQRRHIRVPSSRPVLMIVNQKAIYATMTDFSMHGIGFMSNLPADLHQWIEVHFDIPTDYQSGALRAFQFKAEVKHCLNLSQNNHIGVRLDLPSAEYVAIFNTLTAT
jgi:hypothetical protein